MGYSVICPTPEPDMYTLKEGRATTSCTECQRRKQKCSREWPCNHCQARKVAHLCQFGVKRTPEESPTESARETPVDARGQKRSIQSQESLESSVASSGHSEEPEDGLRAWGYMPGHVYYKIVALEERSQRRNSSIDAAGSNEVARILHAIPPRSITDAIVNHFIRVHNHRYNAIYGPMLTNRYVEWWNDRAKGKRLSPEFTCLLLRICAYSVKYILPALRSVVEFELASDSQALTERFASAAEQLSQSFEPLDMSIERVQEQFLKSAWLRSESKIVKSWHALGCAIRAAQELGADKDNNTNGLSEFDIEIRRRIWVLLYVLDWQMSTWLGRPNIIDQKNLAFEFPTLRLDQSTTEPNLISPFAHISLQAHLGYRMTTILGESRSTTGVSAEQVLEIEAEWGKFIEELPQVFKLEDPDTSMDEEYPHFILQRYQLRCIIYMTMLHFLKPYLIHHRDTSTSFQDGQFRTKGIDIALHILEVARDLSNCETQINSQSQVSIFPTFDTATTLCSAIIHDYEYMLPRRNEIIDAIGNSLDVLNPLNSTSRLSILSYNFLNKLVLATPELHALSSRKRRQVSSASIQTSSPTVALSIETTGPSTNRVAGPMIVRANYAQTIEKDIMPSMTTTDDLSFDLDQFMAQNPLGNHEGHTPLNMSGVEQNWDWGNLNLDGQSDQRPPH